MSAYQWTYTHVHGNTLDLLLTNIEENIHSLLIHSQQRLLSSDHYGRTFRLASKLPTLIIPRGTTSALVSTCWVLILLHVFNLMMSKRYGALSL